MFTCALGFAVSPPLCGHVTPSPGGNLQSTSPCLRPTKGAHCWGLGPHSSLWAEGSACSSLPLLHIPVPVPLTAPDLCAQQRPLSITETHPAALHEGRLPWTFPKAFTVASSGPSAHHTLAPLLPLLSLPPQHLCAHACAKESPIHHARAHMLITTPLHVQGLCLTHWYDPSSHNGTWHSVSDCLVALD